MDIERIDDRILSSGQVAGQAAMRRAGRTTRQPRQSVDTRRTPVTPPPMLSSPSREFLWARAAVVAAPDVRAERVAALKQRIESGTYSVAPEHLARKLLGRV